MVVSMRPLTPADAIRATTICARFPRAHGTPVHIGDPAASGVADVTKPDHYPFDPGFDVIVFSDILEHLYDPIAVLTAHVELLKPGGHILVSLPNIAAWPAKGSRP